MSTSSVNRSVERSLQCEFACVQKWFSCNKLLLKKYKSYGILFGARLGLGDSSDLTISFNDGLGLYLNTWAFGLIELVTPQC